MAGLRLLPRLGLILSLLFSNFLLLTSAQGQSNPQPEKLWQYGAGVIQDFDWIGQNLALATSSGLWQLHPPFSESATRFKPAFDQAVNPVEAGKTWTTLLFSSPDGTRFISRDNDATFRVRDSQTGIALSAIPQKGISPIAWQPGGDLLAVGTYDSSAPVRLQYKIALWDVRTAKPTSTLDGYRVSAMAWDPTGRFLAIRQLDGTISIEDVVQNKELRQLVADRANSSSVAWSPDGTKLATTTWPNPSLKLWQTDTFDALTFAHQPDFVKGLTWSTDSKRLAGIQSDGTIGIWNVDSGITTTLSSEGNDHIHIDPQTGKFAWNGKHLAALDATKHLRVWDTETGKLIGENTQFTDCVQSLSVSHDGKSAALVYKDTSKVVILDGTIGAPKQTLSTPPGKILDITAMAWSPSDEYLAVINGGQIYIWQPQADSQAKIVQVDSLAASMFTWSLDDILVVASTLSQKETVWFVDGKTGKQVLDTRPTPGLVSLKSSPDGKWIALYINKTGDTDTYAAMQIDVWDRQHNTTTTLNFPSANLSKTFPTGSFIWLPDSSALLGFTADNQLWRWTTDSTNVDFIIPGFVNSPSNQEIPLKINSRGDQLAVIERGKMQILDLGSGQQLITFPDLNPILFDWGNDNTLFVYDSTVQAYQIK